MFHWSLVRPWLIRHSGEVFKHAKLYIRSATSYGTSSTRRRRRAGPQGEEDEVVPGGEGGARVARQDELPSHYYDYDYGDGGRDTGQTSQGTVLCVPEVEGLQLQTWLSQTVKLDANGKAEVKVTMPDDANIHDITGVLLTRGSGVAESDPVVLESTNPFSIKCDMPYTVVKGEIFQVRHDRRNARNWVGTAHHPSGLKSAGWPFPSFVWRLDPEALSTAAWPLQVCAS